MYCRIQESLLHALNASPTNWPTLIQNHALSLLRSGEVTTFPDLMSRVLEDIKTDADAARKAEASSNGVNGKDKEGKVEGRGEKGASLALPRTVVDEGVRVTRECLELVCEVHE
jgi:hypothetical protein